MAKINRKLTQAWNTWNDGLGRLGECMVAFQQVEDGISRCVGAMMGRDRRLGAIITSELSYRGKLAVYGAIFLHRTKLAKMPEDVSEVLGRAYEAEQKRNQLVHSIWDPSRNRPDTIKRSKSACRKQGLSVTVEHYTLDDFDDLLRYYECVEEDLYFVTQEYLPKAGRYLH